MPFATVELLRLQHEKASRHWRNSDYYDRTALPMAIVQCDVVVTERHWAHKIRRAGLERFYGAVVIERLKDLVAYVAVA